MNKERAASSDVWVGCWGRCFGSCPRACASLALGDDARRELPRARPAGKLAYLRLHYGSRGKDGNYSAAELDRWRRRIAAWRARREVFVYFNNDWRGFAPANARALMRA